MTSARKIFLLVAAAFVCAATPPTPIGAQESPGTVTGQVVDSATLRGLADVSVVVEGTGRGTVTRDDGTFTIAGVPAGTHTVRVRRIGYGTQTATVVVASGSTASVSFTLGRQATLLEQMVVVGYGSQQRSTITGAVATVDTAALQSRRVPSVAQALQGQVAGVQVTQSTGAPGEEISIRIRGEGTIGNNSPLFIVDGVPSRDIAFLNPADIQSMQS